MKLSLLFLIPEELHHKLMFVCPTCAGQTFIPSTLELETLRCCHCGDTHDGQTAQLEILAAAPELRSLAGRHLRDRLAPTTPKRPKPGNP